MTKMRLVLAAMLACASLHGAAQVVARSASVVPENPAAGEDFMILFEGARPGGTVAYAGYTEVAGNDIVLRTTLEDPGYATLVFFATAAANVPAPGTYNLRFEYVDDHGNSVSQAAGSIRTGPATPASQPQYRNLSGNWFAPAAPGSGVNLVQGDSGALFGAWLTYGSLDSLGYGRENNSLWMVMSAGKWISPTVFRGLLNQFRGSHYMAPYSQPRFPATTFGVMTLTFASATEMDLRIETGHPFAVRQRLQRMAF